MVFKYAAEMNALSHCPPADAVAYDGNAFRFVHSDLDEPRNFLCVRKLNPSRTLGPSHRCSGLGLSFFVSDERARARYKDLKSSNPNIGKTLGTKLAAGLLTPNDGRASRPGGNGHFDLWEAEDADFSGRFRIVADLTP